MNQELQDKLKILPVRPGVYFHKSKTGEIIYVGKAAVLKNRVRQYFQESRSRDNKTLALVNEIVDVDWIETDSEVDALFLESEMVKRYMPRYNILLRDDKSQSFVRIDMKSEWPIVSITRNPQDDGAEYFGPFYNSFALRKALRYLRKIYPYLTSEVRPVSSRLNEDIGISPKLSDGSELYKDNLRKLISYIKGNRKTLMIDLDKEMRLFAKQQDYEQAATARNKLIAMRELQNRVMFGDREQLDISKDNALAQLKKLLSLKSEPRRIEGFDISHISGQAVVSSMVVFLNGVSARADYRKFKISSQQNDDYESIHEVFSRRFSEKNIKSWGIPDLVLVDGDKGQLTSAIKAMGEKAVKVPVIAVAKKLEEIVIHRTLSGIDTSNLEGNKFRGVVVENDFVIVRLHSGQKSHGHARNIVYKGSSLPEFDDLLKLIQRIRDEAHRFAISYHSTIREKRQTENILEQIPGIGPKTRAKLIKNFGSTKRVLEATTEELAQIAGQKVAESISKASSRT